MSDHTIELARRLAELGEKEGAQKAYFLVLQQADGSGPELEMEAASYLFFQRAIIRPHTPPLYLSTTGGTARTS